MVEAFAADVEFRRDPAEHLPIPADSCGFANPTRITATVEAAAAINVIDNLTVQVHDSRGMGLANIARFARIGLRNIDASAFPTWTSPTEAVADSSTSHRLERCERLDQVPS